MSETESELSSPTTGPLAGVRVLEVGGIGPNPFAGMVLADMGADVIRLDRQVGGGFGQAGPTDPTLRGRQTLAVELFELNADFHEQLARCSGNRYFLDAVQRQNKLRSFINIQWVNGAGRVVDSIDEHLLIMDALDGGNNQAASDLMRQHLATAKSVEATV